MRRQSRPSPFIRKLMRFRTGAKLRVLDVCGGAGGFSLGFRDAGFELVGAIESDPIASVTYAQNLHKECRPRDRERYARTHDLATDTPSRVSRTLRLGHVADAVDIVLAGLPCQAFARIGRSKLGAVADDPGAYRKDPRAKLYQRFLGLVRALKPLAVVLENVPDIVNHGQHNVPEEISRELERWGYSCRYTFLNAAGYGVPQLRERLFLIAIHDSVGVEPDFPAPTHRVVAPPGYAGVRQFALKHVNIASSHYMPPPSRKGRLPAAVSVRKAIADLSPILRTGWDASKPSPSRNMNERSGYVGKASGYALAMRGWKGFSTTGSVDAHIVRHTPRDYALFQEMEHGEQYPEMHRRAVQRFEAEILRRRNDGEELLVGSHEWHARKAAMVPPYDPTKFPNKWRKLEPDRLSWTLTAHIGRDTYTHIHYDSKQARTISVREAARLQSFPDGFIFSGSMNSAFRQIGNAVPPLMARAIATRLAELLDVEEAESRQADEIDRIKAAA
jgi:DNA (cytosine-5)-methyltransferase 1